MSGKTIYEMNEAELKEYIQKQERVVEKIKFEKRGALEFESGLLKDAKQLLTEKLEKKQEEDREVKF